MVIRYMKAFEACRTNHLFMYFNCVCMYVLARSNICPHVLIFFFYVPTGLEAGPGGGDGSSNGFLM